MEKEKQKQINSLSHDVLHYSQNVIIVNFRFLDSAVSRLLPIKNDTIPFGTDGRYLVYNPRYLLGRYAKDSNGIVHSYLHTLLHCIFRHNFVSLIINKRLWDLSCDIAVGSVINTLDKRFTNEHTYKLRQDELDRIDADVSVLTAEKIYRYLCDGDFDEVQLNALEKLFREDDHRLWYMTSDDKNTEMFGNSDNDNNSDDDPENNNDDRSNNGNSNSDDSNDDSTDDSDTAPGSEQDWKTIAERIQVDMETMSKSQGDAAGNMLQQLQQVNRERYDYAEFLKKFAVMGEAMQVNDDEFDYVFYTYGLKLYKNMPLIEPLEYKEVKRIREFVIAIDTSGSVEGEIVQTFLQKTYNIMKQTESFFSRINLHIIQCDADIQEHIKITSQQEFDHYMSCMEIRGLGGTDFRPVFDMVDRLIDEKEFYNLKGLIYFTDGIGYFPEKKPEYETAFVFVKEDYSDPIVPPWAIKLILDKDEI